MVSGVDTPPEVVTATPPDGRYPTGACVPLRPRIDIDPHERHRLLPTAGTASREHYALLHRAMWADDRGLISDLAMAMLPTVMGRPDRYGHQNDPYGMEVEPLLSVLVGSALGDMETYADARAEFARLSDAIDMTVLATRRTAADLSAPCRHRLDKGLQTVSTQLRSLTEIANRERAHITHPFETASLFIQLGRVRQAWAIAHVDEPNLDTKAATRVSATLRRLRALDEALSVTQQILRIAPLATAARNDEASIHADMENYACAHHLAKATWSTQNNVHTARVLCRTSKAVGDTQTFSMAVAYLESRKPR